MSWDNFWIWTELNFRKSIFKHDIFFFKGTKNYLKNPIIWENEKTAILSHTFPDWQGNGHKSASLQRPNTAFPNVYLQSVSAPVHSAFPLWCTNVLLLFLRIAVLTLNQQKSYPHIGEAGTIKCVDTLIKIYLLLMEWVINWLIGYTHIDYWLV